ncbi:hypothetical protein ACFOYU_16280 [Microvirga sp. GCM10011540]|uniref:hypothetical protein n=1 Tax=Microvirga sp. GCM10011540 TaxID=3317338 RepID=UPI00360B5F38
MADLILLIFENKEAVRCASLAEAKEKASSHYHAEGRVLVEVTPEGGGAMTTLEFDQNSRDWIAVS